MIEIEIKIRVEDIKHLQKKIQTKEAVLEKNRYLEENTLYDFPSALLYKKQHAIRLRKINKQYFLTFKGAPQKSRKFKMREEFETAVRNGKQMRKILKSLGLKPSFEYRKFRTVFKKKKLKICLDELEIGNFLELEGERNDIVKFASDLGFSKKDFIKHDYIQLIKDQGGKKSREESF
jgi:adenylate cyclase class 2